MSPSSRTPSTNRLLDALNPRRLNMSPAVFDAPPPSPACSVMPGTLRSASLSVKAACSSITFLGITATDCATSRSGTRYLGDDTAAALPETSTTSDNPPTSSVTLWPENLALTEVPCSSCVMAACGVRLPETPGDSMRPRSGLVKRTGNPVARVNAAATTCSGPAGMSKRWIVRAWASNDPSGIGACAATGRATTALVATAAPKTNSRAVPRLRRVTRRPRNLIFFMVRMLPGVPSLRCRLPSGRWLELLDATALDPGQEPSQRERNGRPDQDDATGRNQTSHCLTGEPEHFPGVREAHHVPNPASGREGVERFVGDDASRPCERQRGPKVGLAAISPVDGEDHRRARCRGQTKVDGAPVRLPELGLREKRS